MAAAGYVITLVLFIILAIIAISLAIPSELDMIQTTGYVRIGFWVAFVLFVAISAVLVKMML